MEAVVGLLCLLASSHAVLILNVTKYNQFLQTFSSYGRTGKTALCIKAVGFSLRKRMPVFETGSLQSFRGSDDHLCGFGTGQSPMVNYCLIGRLVLISDRSDRIYADTYGLIFKRWNLYSRYILKILEGSYIPADYKANNQDSWGFLCQIWYMWRLVILPYRWVWVWHKA